MCVFLQSGRVINQSVYFQMNVFLIHLITDVKNMIIMIIDTLEVRKLPVFQQRHYKVRLYIVYCEFLRHSIKVKIPNCDLLLHILENYNS